MELLRDNNNSGSPDSQERLSILRDQIAQLNRKCDFLKQCSIVNEHILGACPAALFKISSKGNFEYINPNIGRLIGFTANEIEAIGFDGFMSRINPEYKASFASKFSELADSVLSEISSSIVVFSWLNKYSASIWLQLIPVPSESGKVQAFLCSMHKDSIPESWTPIESDDFNKEVLVPVLVLGDDKVLYSNKAASDILNLSYDQLTSFNRHSFLQNIIHHQDRDLFKQKILSVFHSARKIIIEFEFRIKTGLGTEKWISAQAARITFNNEPAVEVVFFDITKRKSIENELVISEARFRSLIEDNTEFILRATQDGTLTFINNACARFFAINPVTSIGRNVFDLISEKKRKALHANINILTPESPCSELENEFVIDGKIVYTKWIIRGIFDNAGKLTEIQSVGRDITNEKISFIKLKENEEQLLAILDSIKHTVVFISDPQDIIVFLKCSPGLINTYGFDSNEQMFNNLEKMVRSPRSRIAQTFYFVKKTKESFKFEDSTLLPNGQFQFEVTFSPIVDSSGAITRIVTICNDITEKARMDQQALFRLKLETLLTNISTYFLNLPSQKIDEGMGIALRSISEFLKTDRCFIYELCHESKTLRNKYQWSAQDSTDSPLPNDNLTFEDCSYFLEPLSMLKHIHIPDMEAIKNKAKIGKLVNIHKAKSLVIIPMIHETKLTGFMGFESHAGKRFFEDEIISLLKVASEILVNVITRKRLEDELSRSEEQTRSIFDSTDDFILVWSEDDKVLYTNNAFLRYCEKTREEVIGKSPLALILPGEEHIYQIWHERVHKVLSTGESINLRDQTYTKNQELYTDSTLSPLRDNTGKIYAVAIQARNITENERNKNELDTYREKILQTEQLASLGTMSATLTHELNQPLTVLRLFIQQSLRAARNLDDCPKLIIDNLTESVKELNNANNIINRFKNFARKLPRDTVVKVDVKAVMDKIIAALAKNAARAGLEIVVENLENLPALNANLGELEQIFFILIQNAIQAVDPERKNILKIYASNNDETVSIFFDDTCKGIAPENLDKIYDAFFTTKPPEVGTGLGLAIIKQILTGKGGRINVSSTLGRGTCFELQIPVT